MKNIILFLFVLAYAVGCSSNNDHKEIKNNYDNPPTSIKVNKSVVMAEIISIESKTDSEFEVNIKVEEVLSYSGSMSMVEVKKDYLLTPALEFDEEGELKSSERNNNLIELKQKVKGDKVKCEVTLSKEGKWKILKLIN